MQFKKIADLIKISLTHQNVSGLGMINISKWPESNDGAAKGRLHMGNSQPSMQFDMEFDNISRI